HRSLPSTPFRFLERFTADDAEIFFGRNRDIRDLYKRVTSPDGAGVILLYGQSGAGKSSFLEAGLLPRLETAHSVKCLRRDRAKGLLGTLLQALDIPGNVTTSAELGASLVSSGISLRTAWLTAESSAGRPLVIVLDQAEEAFSAQGGNSSEFG